MPNVMERMHFGNFYNRKIYVKRNRRLYIKVYQDVVVT